MKIGIEEEFITIDSSNLFYTPAAPKILLSMLAKNGIYLSKSSLETPLGRHRFPKSFRELENGFTIVEIKTSPHRDIDSLKEEIIFHRKNLIDAASDNDISILPVGIHPFFSQDLCGIENCAALHIHVGDIKKKCYFNILKYVPHLIALTANSPFVRGKFLAMCSRALYSPSIGIPRNFYERTSDLIINNCLNTIELRACDTQIFPDDVIGAAAVIECLALLSESEKISRSKYETQRKNAIYFGKEKLDTNVLFNKISSSAEELGLTDYVTHFFTRMTGAEWQCRCLQKYNFSTLIESLCDSMKTGNYKIKSSKNMPESQVGISNNLYYLIPYLPIMAVNIIKKIRQDDAVNTTTLFGRHPEKIESELLFDNIE